MTDADNAKFLTWQSSDEGKAEIAAWGAAIAIDDMTDAAKTREGVHAIRKNIALILDMRNKLNDLVLDLNLVQMAAE